MPPEFVDSVFARGFRGIVEARVDGLAPLTIITGPNGSCKSALVDALLVGASPTPGDAVGRAITRQRSVTRGVHWLWHRGPKQDLREQALVAVRSSEGWWLARWLERGADQDGDLSVEVRELAGTDVAGYPPTDRPERSAPASDPPSPLLGSPLLGDLLGSVTTAFHGGGYVVHEGKRRGGDLAGRWRFAKLIDPADVTPLVTSFSDAERGGFGAELDALIHPLGYDRLKIMEDPEARRSPCMSRRRAACLCRSGSQATASAPFFRPQSTSPRFPKVLHCSKSRRYFSIREASALAQVRS